MNTTAFPPLYYRYLHKMQIDLLQLIRLEGKGNYTRFVFLDGKTQLSAKTLCIYEPHLPSGFIRVHKNCVVNWRFVTKLNISTKTVQMADGHEISISRRRWAKISKKVVQLKFFLPTSQ